MNWTSSSKRWRASIFLLALPVCWSASAQPPRQVSSEIKKPLIYQIGEYVHINATGERPLLQAIDALQQKYGWAIDYEDPQYIVAPGAAQSRTSSPHRLHSMALASDNGFSVQFKVPPDSPPDEEMVLSTILDAYNQSGGPARFQLVKQGGGRFDVVGVAATNAQGEMVSQEPVLGSRITIAPAQRSAGETISLICEKVSHAAKVQISPAPIPSSPQTMVGGSNVTARSLLARVLDGQSGWRLIYDPSGRSYRLTVNSLRQ